MLTPTGLKATLDTNVRNKTAAASLTPANEADAIQAGYDYTDQEVATVAARATALEAKLLAVRPAPQVLVQSRFEGYHQGFSDGSQQMVTYQYLLRPTVDIVGAQFEFGNWSVGTSATGNGERIGLNPITIGFCVYLGDFNVGTFQGQGSVALQPGASVKSDPFPYILRAGSTYFLRIRVSVATAGMVWPLGITTVGTDVYNNNGEGSFNGDALNGPGIGGNTGFGYHPFKVTGTPLITAQGYTALFGDSITAANGTDDTVDQGWVRRGFDTAGLPWLRMASGSLGTASYIDDVSTNPVDRDFHIALAASRGYTSALVAFGSNDIANNEVSTLAQLQAREIRLWNAVGSKGERVYTSTILPRLGFSSPQEAIRTQDNDWKRDGAPILNGIAVATGSNATGTLRAGMVGHPLKGYVEAADLGETARNSGIQKAGYFNGPHPTPTGAIAISACITAAQFAL